MKLDRKKLAALQGLTDMMRDARQAKIATIQGAITTIKEQRDEMDAQLSARAQDTGTDIARQAGADFLWQKWTDGQKMQLNQQMALQMNALEVERERLKVEFGKSEAVKKLRKVSEDARKLQEQRKI